MSRTIPTEPVFALADDWRDEITPAHHPVLRAVGTVAHGPKRNLFQRHNRWWLAEADWPLAYDGTGMSRALLLACALIPVLNLFLAFHFARHCGRAAVSDESIRRFFLGEDDV